MSLLLKIIKDFDEHLKFYEFRHVKKNNKSIQIKKDVSLKICFNVVARQQKT